MNGIKIFKRLLCSKITSHQKELMARSLPKKKPLPGVKDIVLVASGKGGVGKSTTAVNLAVCLAQSGQRVGLLDADLFGPSIPLMMNLTETPLVDDENRIIPPMNYGVKCLSLGLLTEMKPAIWRGPLVMSATERLLKGTAWAPLDILVVDTPPGTGDIHLSLIQNVPVSGVLLVSTPQLAALRVTQRGAEMFRVLNVPILGLVENMSSVQCPNCSTEINIFGNETDKVAKEMEVDVLERIQIDKEAMCGGDSGIPLTIQKPTSPYAETFQRLAKIVQKRINRDEK
uniref:Uncharacterized protein n=2 Tax=Lutzomyia longipalpis TaxID=7200 RepID=A0A1B0GI88_LUTLO